MENKQIHEMYFAVDILLSKQQSRIQFWQGSLLLMVQFCSLSGAPLYQFFNYTFPVPFTVFSQEL